MPPLALSSPAAAALRRLSAVLPGRPAFPLGFRVPPLRPSAAPCPTNTSPCPTAAAAAAIERASGHGPRSLGAPGRRVRRPSARAVAAAAGGGVGPQLQRRVRHILVPEGDGADDLLQRLEEQLAGGADMAALAREHSKCPSGARGGDLGFLAQGQTVAEFDAAAFELPVGAVARVKSSFGLHILRVEEEQELATVQDMEVEELKAMLDDDAACEGVQFVDVREMHELELAALPRFVPYPLSQFSEWAPTIKQRLDPTAPTVVLCHHGVRSMQAASFLVAQGFQDVRNVTGGIDRYSIKQDPNVPLY